MLFVVFKITKIVTLFFALGLCLSL